MSLKAIVQHGMRRSGISVLLTWIATLEKIGACLQRRMGCFLMNVMCASGGYPWIIIPVEQRKHYMNALEKASIKQNIKPFCKFLAELII